MATVNPFDPSSKTYLISTSSVQVVTGDNINNLSYRVRNIGTTQAYFRYAPPAPLGASVTVGTVSAPSAGTPSENTIGMFPNSVEVFTLPPNCWFKSDTANAFEVTCGIGV